MLDSAPDVAYNAIQMDGKRVPAITTGFLELSPNSFAADGEPAKGGNSIRNGRESGGDINRLDCILL